MTLVLLSIFLGVSVILLVTSIVLIGILANKIHSYEEWISTFKENVENSLMEMREIDKRGTFATSMNVDGLFESDDEVGRIFKEMEEIIAELNQKSQ